MRGCERGDCSPALTAQVQVSLPLAATNEISLSLRGASATACPDEARGEAVSAVTSGDCFPSGLAMTDPVSFKYALPPGPWVTRNDTFDVVLPHF